MHPTSDMLRQPAQVKRLKLYHYLMMTLFALICTIAVHLSIDYWFSVEYIIYIYIAPFMLFIFSLIAPAVIYQRTGYRLNKFSIETTKGLFWHHRSAIPIDRIQHVTISTGPLTQKLNLAKITVYTSGESIALPYIDMAEAENIALLITERIKEVTAYV
ncbi:hypothetical protein ERX37_10360 [Macrococcus hajekii]|uniref:YdbS-like PH domain-containing protein n=1 Tax=Macrococcus hajekii TaxID=198482 RepID=A0A4R6BHL6_9STAP|nr:PH domain-containing protein [Macrococcus hajekii]TDM01077.1 hypothetical protein ERX37_10360 [Macrococcus hajekii]GGB12585.1 membrane protein [Macrococcus hajekii]